MDISESLERGYVPTTLPFWNDDRMRTEACVFNYYSYFGLTHGACRFHVWLFDRQGRLAGSAAEPVPVGGQLQLDTARIAPGTFGLMATALIPDDGFRAVQGRYLPTGFYAMYASRDGGMSISHEGSPVARRSFAARSQLSLYRREFLDRAAVLLSNPCLAGPASGDADGSVEIRRLGGEVLASVPVPPIPPLSAAMLDLGRLAAGPLAAVADASLAVNVAGRNLGVAMSYNEAPGGRFSIHHF